jgi:O-acetyl-ADP-ribose deacetylase
LQKRVNGLVLEVLKGDIVKQNDVTAIVNAANAQLKRGGGVAGAIHRAAGPGLEKECEPLAPISPGEAVITGGHNLPNKYVIHCLGPVYGRDKPESTILKKCYYNSLKLADEEGIDSIAFPAISTGAFGYPVRKAASIAFRAVKEVVPELKNIELIRFVLFSEKDYEVHKKALEENY